MSTSKMTRIDAVQTIKRLFNEEMKKYNERRVEDSVTGLRDFDIELLDSSAWIRRSQQEQERYVHQSFRQASFLRSKDI